MIRSKSKRVWAVSATVIAIIAAGCGSDRPPIADDGSRNPLPTTGPCSVDGATRSCHALVSKHEGFVDCFSGTQTCINGGWTPCGGTGTLSSHALALSPGNVEPASLGPSSNSGPPCSLDPCNPYCSGYNETPATPIGPTRPTCLPPPPTPPTAPPYEGATFPGNLPGAVQGGGLCDNAHGCTSCAMGGPERCQFDHHCDTATGKCVQNAFGYQTPGCATVNLTLGLACSNGGNVAAPICNRGSVAAPAGTYSISAYAAVGTAVPAPTACPPPAPGPLKGTCNTVVPIIPPGACVSADFGSCAIDFSGDTWLVINSPTKTVNPECGEIAAPGCADNYSYYKSPGNPCTTQTPPPPLPPPPPPVPPPSSYSQTYTMPDCPPSTRGQWGLLAYDVTTPPGSRVKFGLQTGPTTTGPWTPAAAGPPGGVQVADAPTDHPQVCSMTGPLPCGNTCGPAGTSACPASCSCPIDIFTPLSSPSPLTKVNAQQPVLQMNVQFQSSGASGTGPKLCAGGSGAGNFCVRASDCPGGTCTTYVGVCVGGGSNRSPCNIAANCPSGTCTSGGGVCLGGSSNGSLCVNAAQCPGGTCATGGCTGLLSSGLLTTLSGSTAGCSGGKDDFQATCTADPYFSCQQDFHCDTTLNGCVWNVPTNYFDPNCKDAAGNPGIDLQIGAPCGTTVPLCNRGGGTVPAGTVVPFYNSMNGSSGRWDCVTTPTAPGSSAGSYTLTAPLGPGRCVNVYGLNFDTGQRDLYVNPTRTITECGSGFAGSGGGCRNNSASVKSTGAGCTPRCGPGAAGIATPTLNSWQVTYACVPAE
jgi:hypothetical protein